MLRYKLDDLSENSRKKLKSLQDKVDAIEEKKEKREKATSLFNAKSDKELFKEIRDSLSKASPPEGACYYCERDRYRDIEHVKPKRHYPELCFDWENYVYACAICNQDRKKDTYAVMDGNGNVIEFNRLWPIDKEIPEGIPMLIDIRHEDPLDFLKLDLETGVFFASGDGDVAVKKGEFTKNLFGLNDASLARIRKHAVSHFKSYMERYVAASKAGDGNAVKRIRSEILELTHPTVLVEMRRQSRNHEDLRQLFEVLPEEIGARP